LTYIGLYVRLLLTYNLSYTVVLRENIGLLAYELSDYDVLELPSKVVLLSHRSPRKHRTTGDIQANWHYVVGLSFIELWKYGLRTFRWFDNSRESQDLGESWFLVYGIC